MTDRILLPTDGDPGAEQAIEHAVDLAGILNATLYVLYVVDETIYEIYEDEELTDAEPGPKAALEKQGEQALEPIVEEAEAEGIDVEKRMRYGRPADEIVAEADDIDADLLVLGSRTMPDEYRTQVGSVADEVMRLTDRSVTVVKTPVPAEDS